MIDVLDYVEHLSDSLHPIFTIYRVASFIYKFTRKSATQGQMTLRTDGYLTELNRHDAPLNQLLIEVDQTRYVADTEFERMRIERDYIACQAELARGIWTNDRWPVEVQAPAAIAWAKLNTTWAQRFPEALSVNASTPILVFQSIPLPRS